MKQATETFETLRVDADITTARNINIPSTKTEQTITHDLGRIAIGVQIIKMNKLVTMYVAKETKNQVSLVFSATEANINIRIW